MKRSNYEVTRLVNYARKASPEDLMEDYGIELIEHGQVFDTVEERTYKSVVEWAESVVDDDVDDEYEYGSRRSRYDDEE